LSFNNFENVISEKALIFHASSALQYLNESLVDVVLKFETLPNYIIINRTPFSTEKSFYSIQNGGSSDYVMKIISFNEIDKLLEYYEILDDWFDNIDKCDIPFKSTKIFFKGYLLKIK
jgi:putative methyltransferase (TIGR04325 family)